MPGSEANGIYRIARDAVHRRLWRKVCVSYNVAVTTIILSPRPSGRIRAAEPVVEAQFTVTYCTICSSHGYQAEHVQQSQPVGAPRAATNCRTCAAEPVA
eukprot:277713-Heterocapsa_arctica.AAC.1